MILNYLLLIKLYFLQILFLFPLGHGVEGVAYNYSASIEVTTNIYLYICNKICSYLFLNAI